MWLKLQAINGILRLVTGPAIEKRLFSTVSTSQQWVRPDKEFKYYNDPEWRRNSLDKRIARHRHRMQSDPDYRKRKLAMTKAWHLQRAGEETFKRERRLLGWCYTYGWFRDKLPWKAYIPKLYKEKVQHHCTGCKLGPHKKKLWWCHIDRSMDHEQSDASPENSSAAEKYNCTECYLKTGWENVIPRGFEDVTSIREVRARARELGIDIDHEVEREKHVSDQTLQRQGTSHDPRT